MDGSEAGDGSCSIVEGYQDAVVVNGLLRAWLVQRFAQQLHDKCRKRHFIGSKHCDNIGMLAGFQDLELSKKLNDHVLIKLWFQDAFQGAWGYKGATGMVSLSEKPISVAPLASKPLQKKDVSPVIAVVGRSFVWCDLGRFVARWLLAKNHGLSLIHLLSLGTSGCPSWELRDPSPSFHLSLLPCMEGFKEIPPVSSQRSRSTTWTEAYLSQVAFARIGQSMAFQTAKQRRFGSSGNLLWKDLSMPHLSHNHSLGLFSQKQKYRGRPSSATLAYAPTSTNYKSIELGA